jgi:hypothetical protein
VRDLYKISNANSKAKINCNRSYISKDGKRFFMEASNKHKMYWQGLLDVSEARRLAEQLRLFVKENRG